MRECPFCNCTERILAENTHAFVILSNPLKIENHLLVIPKRHIEQPWELTAEERNAVYELIDHITPRIATRYGGCDLRQNYRPFLPQGRLKVNHVHYHLIPRSYEDELYQKVERFETDVFRDATDGDNAAAQRMFES